MFYYTWSKAGLRLNDNRKQRCFLQLRKKPVSQLLWPDEAHNWKLTLDLLRKTTTPGKEARARASSGAKPHTSAFHLHDLGKSKMGEFII